MNTSRKALSTRQSGNLHQFEGRCRAGSAVPAGCVMRNRGALRSASGRKMSGKMEKRTFR